MAPLNPNSTVRMDVKYTSFNLEHTLQFRFQDGQSASGALAIVTPVLEALATVMRSDDAFLSANFALNNEDFSFPVAFTPINGTGSNSVSGGDYQSTFCSFVGRDAVQGRRVRYEFFTASATLPHPDNNRINAGEDENIDAILAALLAAATDAEPGAAIVTIAKQPPLFNNYANVAFNSYWQRKQRRSGV